MFGIINIKKPVGPTSHQVINKVRRFLGIKRCGHAGTLDPLASGVLLVAYGPATRLIPYMDIDQKEYIANIKLGCTSSTYDLEGELTSVVEHPAYTEKEILDALQCFSGKIIQTPPIYSAVKVSGKELYKYARKGQSVEIPERKVTIYEIELLENHGDCLTIRVLCSSGTYIRTLASDIGKQLKCGAYLQSLIRTKVGQFDIKDAKDVEDLQPESIVDIEMAFHKDRKVHIKLDDEIPFNSGRLIPACNISNPINAKTALVFSCSNEVLGIGEQIDAHIHPKVVLRPYIGNKIE